MQDPLRLPADPTEKRLTPTQPATVRAICRRCGHTWDVIPITSEFLSAPIVPGLCQVCDQELECIKKEQLLKQRSLKLQRLFEQREKEWTKLCPIEYRLITEGNGKTEIARLELLNPKLNDILAWNYGERGLIIRSRTSGRGKTRSAWRLLRKQWLDHHTLACFTAGMFQRKAQDAAGKFQLDEWFNRQANTDILFLDDLGKGNWTENTEAIWFDLVETRTSQGRPIIITTNLKGDDLTRNSRSNTTRFTIRRLREFCDVVALE
jgi:hypothetical protein